MNRNRRTEICSVPRALGICVLIASLLGGCSSTKPEAFHASPAASFPLQELLSRLPARDASEARMVSALMLESAPENVARLCAQLDTTKPGNDAQLRYALSGLTSYATMPGHQAERGSYVIALNSALGRMHTPPSKAFVIQQLQAAGGQESVETLSPYLRDAALCESAAQALLSIRTPEVAGKMLEAVRQVDGARRLTLVKALGELQTRDIVPDLMKWAKEDDPSLREASLEALAAIGDPHSNDLMQTPQLRLTYARSLAKAGNRDLSERICQAILSSKTSPDARPAALYQLASLRGDSIYADLYADARDLDPVFSATALDLAAKLKPGSESASKGWQDVLRQATPEQQADVVKMLGRRTDAASLAIVYGALKDQQPVVRIAAVEAATRLGGGDAIDAMMSLLERTDRADEIAAVRNVLVSLSPKQTIPALVRTLPSATAPAQVMLLQYSAGCGNLVPSSGILALVRHESPAVRQAAIKTLEAVAGPDDMPNLVQSYLAARGDADANAMRRTIAAVAGRTPAESRANAILGVLDTAASTNKAALLRALGRVSGQKSLAVLSRNTASKDPSIKDAALRALAEWPDMQAFDTLLAVAKSKQPLNYKVLAVRACLRIVDDAHLPSGRAARLLEKVVAAAPRVEEKRMALASLGNTSSTEAVRIASGYLGDDSVGLDAALAIQKIAAEDEAVTPHTPAYPDIIKMFVEKNASSRVRNQFKEYREAHSGLNTPPEGFTALFNGKDLTGWKGLVADPPARSKMTSAELAKAQTVADSVMKVQWIVDDGVLMFTGEGYANICTAKDYTNFEMLVDWKIEKEGDSGIYLRGSPQVQIWDPAMWPEGSGGLYNNQKNPRSPLQKADKPVGQWNTFRIRMVGDRVTVYLNDVLVVDNVILENYWEREKPIYPTGQIELQAHSSQLYFRNIFIRELPAEKEKFSGLLFNGKDLTGWELVGGSTPWGVKDGVLFTEGGGGGWITTVKEYENYKLDLEFRVPEGGNSGVFLRTPREGDPTYVGMEIQVLDDYAPVYATLQPWQYAGSIYGVQAPSVRASKKAGEWQHFVIVCDGPHVTVTLNDQKIIDADLVSHLDQESTHPGLKRRKGFIGLQNHETKIEYRNVRIIEL
jgi:HEAT repeat protein